jgi:hypothetical protein
VCSLRREPRYQQLAESETVWCSGVIFDQRALREARLRTVSNTQALREGTHGSRGLLTRSPTQSSERRTCVRILEDSVVRAMLSRSCRNATGSAWLLVARSISAALATSHACSTRAGSVRLDQQHDSPDMPKADALGTGGICDAE